MSIAAFTRPETPADALNLKVRAAGENTPQQFWIENDHMRLEGHDREYVSFSGFYGKHGPEVFAAAPEMAAFIQKYVDAWRYGTGTVYLIDEAEAILASIEGKS